MAYFGVEADMRANSHRRAPSVQDSSQIHALRQLIRKGKVKMSGDRGHRLALPPKVIDLLDEILVNLQAGREVSIVAEHQELTTQRAANLLGVSRPFMVRLLEQGYLPFHMAGSHRRVYLKDVLAYKQSRDERRHASIDQLARMDLLAGTYDTVVLPEKAEKK